MSSREFYSEALVMRVLDYLDQERAIAFAVLAPDLKVLDASERFRKYQGDSSVDPIGRTIGDVMWELVGSEAALMEVLQGASEIFSLGNINRDLDGRSTLYLSLKALPLEREKPGQGLLLIVEDTSFTSMLKQQLVQDRNLLRLAGDSLANANDDLLKLNRLKSLFLSIAAHDLRSPLTAMRGYTDLAIKSLPEDAQPDTGEYLSVVLSLVDTLNRLISDFLDLDVIEQGNLNLRPVPCDMNDLVERVSGVMKDIAGRKGVEIETRLSKSLPSIDADPDRVRQILFNLVGNAVKYTAEGDRVTIRTRLDEDHIVLSVQDSGPGIPEAEIPRLFDLYHRTEGARLSRVQGLGLGLFIVKSLVDLHHGRIVVRSELGAGTEFEVSIPRHQAAAGEAR